MQREWLAVVFGLALCLTMVACADDAGGGSTTDVGGDAADAGGDVEADVGSDTTEDPVIDTGGGDAEADADADADADAPGEPDTGANSPPVPTADAITTFKNTDGTSQIAPNDPDVGDSHSYAIQTQPTQGTATVSAAGLVTYTPGANYTGADSLVVSVTDAADASATVSVGVTVTNRAPAPTADAITTAIQEDGTSQITVNDPDPSDPATFEVTTAPLLGSATVSETGLVTFTPNGDAYGADSLTVTVTDGSGATADVVIDVSVTLYEYDGTGGTYPVEQCEQLLGHISLVSMTPAPGTVLDAGTEVEFAATIWYSIDPDDELSFVIQGNVDSSDDPTPTNPESDCGTIELSGSATIESDGGTVFVLFPMAEFEIHYHISTGDPVTNVFARFDAVSLPPGTLITEPYYEVLAEISFDLSDYGTAITNAEVDLWDSEMTGSKLYHYFYPISPRDRMPVRLPGRVSCDERATGFLVQAGPSSLANVSAYLTYPSIAPSVEVYQPFVELAVSGVDSTIETGADGCGGPVDAVLTASDAWFEPTVSELSIETDTTIGITVHGAMLTEGEVNVGTLTIAPQVADDWPAVEVPVRVIRLPFDLGESGPYTRLDLDSDRPDDAVALIELTDFTFPAEGNAFDEILVNSNGMIGLQLTGGTPIECANSGYYENPQEAWDAFEPDYQGCPVIAPGWSDHGFFLQHGDLEDPYPGIYYRFGSTDDVDWLEIVFWNFQMYCGSSDGYRLNSTRVVRLREDGTFSMAFPIANFGGFEMVGWAHSDGSIDVPLVPPLSISHGDLFEFDAIPALVSD